MPVVCGENMFGQRPPAGSRSLYAKTKKTDNALGHFVSI